jgi:hypothetical protein
MKNFAVTSSNFLTYSSFKKLAESYGWSYNYYFTKFDESNMIENDCLYFSSNWLSENDYKFSLSNHDDTLLIDLDENYDKAVVHLMNCKSLNFEERCELIEFAILKYKSSNENFISKDILNEFLSIKNYEKNIEKML